MSRFVTLHRWYHPSERRSVTASQNESYKESYEFAQEINNIKEFFINTIMMEHQRIPKTTSRNQTITHFVHIERIQIPCTRSTEFWQHNKPNNLFKEFSDQCHNSGYLYFDQHTKHSNLHWQHNMWPEKAAKYAKWDSLENGLLIHWPFTRCHFLIHSKPRSKWEIFT